MSFSHSCMAGNQKIPGAEDPRQAHIIFTTLHAGRLCKALSSSSFWFSFVLLKHQYNLSFKKIWDEYHVMLLTLMTACNINDRYCCELLWKISSSKIPEASRKM